MAEIMAIRVMGGLCLWSSGLCLVAPGHDQYAFIIAEIILAGVGMDISYRLREHGFLRLPALFLPLIGMAVANSYQITVSIAAQYDRVYFPALLFLKEHRFSLAVIPVMLYLLAISEVGTYKLVYWSYKRNFIFGLIPATALVFFNFLSYHRTFDTYFLVFLYVVIGSFCMHQLRLGEASDRRVKLINALSMGGLTLVAAGVSKFLMQFERLDWIHIWSGLFLGVGYAMQGMAAAATAVTEVLQDLYLWADTFFTGKMVKSYDNTHLVYDTSGTHAHPVDEKTALVVASVIFIVLLIAMIIWLLPRLQKRTVVKRYRRMHKPVVSWTQQTGIRVKKEKREKGNRGKIRATYREYLLMVLKRGAFWEVGDTSKDITEKAMFYGETEKCAEELREIYLKVRYATDYEPEAEEVKKARRLLKQLKSEK